MGIPSNSLPYKTRQLIGDLPPDKPQRAKRGAGKVGKRKARFAQLVNEAKSMPGMLEFVVPIRVISEANNRDHWTAKRGKNGRATKQKEAMSLALFGLRYVVPTLPVTVTLTRIGPKELDSHDNLRGSFKAVVDAIAAFYDIADNDARIKFEYAQEPGSREYGVRIHIGGRQ